MLYRLVKKFKPGTIVELGTSLGITTAYMASANPDATVVTIEGSQAVREIAAANFQKLAIKNINAIGGNFDAVLPTVIDQLESVGLAYIDGNHRYQPTLDYFKQFLFKASPNTVMIFDDIHWSSGMEKAWEEIKAHPQVRCTIDIFSLGFVFFSEEFKEKQHFTIRY